MAVSSVIAPGLEFISADWPAAANIHAGTTTRSGGVSVGACQGLNLATHVQDKAEHVARNREILATALQLPGEPHWLNQVHSARVIRPGEDADLTADAACTDQPGVVCAVLTADCLPVLFTDREGTCVGIAHAGWRGLHAGVISATLDMMLAPGGCKRPRSWSGWGRRSARRHSRLAPRWSRLLSPEHPANASAFTPSRPDHWLGDIYRLARLELAQAGVTQVYGGGLCTFSEPERFYSYRRDGETGRIASLIWMGTPG